MPRPVYPPGILMILTALPGCFNPPSNRSHRLADRWQGIGPLARLASNPTQPARAGKTLTDDSNDQLQKKSFHLRGRASPPESPEPATPRPGLFATLPEDDKFWYLDLGFRVGHTRLESTNDQLNKRLELPLKFDLLGLFNNPTTPLDRKTEGSLTTTYLGIGRRETEWLTWNFYFGIGLGGDHNHQRGGNANLNVNFDYALYYTGLTADIYPWGLPKYADFSDWIERLRASRAYLLTGIEFGYLRAKGYGNFKLAPLTLYADEVKIRDFLASYLIGLGWELPINKRWSFNWSGHYTFHVYRPEEYNGWNVAVAIRYRF